MRGGRHPNWGAICVNQGVFSRTHGVGFVLEGVIRCIFLLCTVGFRFAELLGAAEAFQRLTLGLRWMKLGLTGIGVRFGRDEAPGGDLDTRPEQRRDLS